MKFIGSIITRIGDYFNPMMSADTQIQNHPRPSLEKGRVAILHDKINSARNFVSDFFLILVFVISVWIAFFMGRTYKFMENRPAFYFESLEAEQKYQQQILAEEKEKLFSKFQKEGGGGAAAQNKMIVASKGGKKYYFVWCSGAGNIKEANKRYFADEAAAEKAGYSKAASCK